MHTLKGHIYSFRFIILIVLCGILGYWQMFEYTLKWDNTNQFLPFRYFIDTIFKSGSFPLWNPYINLGYPIYGDPQSGVWYPFTWLNSLLGGYTFRSFNIEVWLHYILAGIGMYRVGQAMRTNKIVAFSMGIAYMFCGFFVGTSQVYPWVIGATWLPFIIADLLRIDKHFSWFNILRLAFFLSLMVLGAYPAFIIILFYIFLLFYGRQFIRSGRNKFLVKQWFFSAVAILLTILLLCSGYLYSIAETFPYISRVEALEYSEYFYFTSFTFQAAISFLFPFAVTVQSEWFNSDYSMLNGYFGALTIPFIIYALVKIKSRNLWWLFLTVIILFLSATGGQTPIRFWLYKFIPGFDMFRHPSIFRVFIILGLLIIFGKGFQHFIENKTQKKKVAPFFLSLFIVVLLSLIISWSLFDTKQLLPLLEFYWSYQFPSSFAISGHIFVQSIILSILLGSLLFYIYKSKYMFLFCWVYVALLFVDLFFATQLNIPSTVIDHTELAEADEQLGRMPKTLTGQSLEEHIKNIDDAHSKIYIPGTYRNKTLFTKRTAFGSYNPYQLKSFNELERSEYWDPSTDVPLFFLSNTLAAPGHSDLKARTLNVEQVIFDQYQKGNPVPFESKIHSFEIGANQFQVEYYSEQDQFMALVQNYMPNWKVWIDGKESELIQYNHALMAVRAPSGSHTIQFTYSSPWIPWLLILNISGLLALALYLLRKEFKRPDQSISSFV